MVDLSKKKKRKKRKPLFSSCKSPEAPKEDLQTRRHKGERCEAAWRLRPVKSVSLDYELVTKGVEGELSARNDALGCAGMDHITV